MRVTKVATTVAVGSLLLVGAGCTSADSSAPVSSATAATAADQAAHCPPGSTPDTPGPPHQARPTGDLFELTAAMDPQSQRMVVWDPVSQTTWTFDVCTNTWQPMHPTREPGLASSPSFRNRLVYDARTHQTLALSLTRTGGLDVWAYSVQANRWTPLSSTSFPYEVVFHLESSNPVVDPVTGRVIVLLHGASNTTLWAYDPASGTVTLQAGAPVLASGCLAGYCPPLPSLLSYDPIADRAVLTLLGAPGATWTYDLRTGIWAQKHAAPPPLTGAYFESGGEATFDTDVRRTLIYVKGVMGTYDTATDRWTVIAPSPGSGWSTQATPAKQTSPQMGPLGRQSETLVYDPINQRILMLGGYVLTAKGWQSLDDVWAYNPASNTWTQLVAPKHPFTEQ